MILFRPIGLRELELIADDNFQSFPPRLPEQPIFYPAVTLEYARMIATDWNTEDEASGFIGFVTRFEIPDDYARRYPVQVVGGRDIQELWVPAEELDELNRNLTGPIEIVETYPGPRYDGEVNPATGLPDHVEVPRRTAPQGEGQ